MPSTAIAAEKFRGRSGEARSPNNKEDRAYIVTNAADVADAINTTLAIAPLNLTTDEGGTLYRGPVEWEEITNSPDGSTTAYEIRVTYAAASKIQSDAGTCRISYDTTGGTIHTENAQEEVAVYRADTSAAAPSFDGFIGVNGTDVAGVDVPVPVFNMTVTKVFTPLDLPSPGDVFALTGTTNDADFQFTDSITGETFLLQHHEGTFLGARHGDPRPDGLVEMTFLFTGSPNVTNRTIGDITGIDKKGSEYLWVYKEAGVDGTGPNKVLIPRAKFAIVDKVIVDGDWDPLKLNTL